MKPPLPQRKYPESLSFNQAKQLGYVATNKTRIEILYRYQGRCFVCGIEEWRYKATLDLHRVIPGKLGGLYTLDNIIPVCGKCHRTVEGKTWDELNSVQSPPTKWTEGGCK